MLPKRDQGEEAEASGQCQHNDRARNASALKSRQEFRPVRNVGQDAQCCHEIEHLIRKGGIDVADPECFLCVQSELFRCFASDFNLRRGRIYPIAVEAETEHEIAEMTCSASNIKVPSAGLKARHEERHRLRA